MHEVFHALIFNENGQKDLAKKKIFVTKKFSKKFFSPIAVRSSLDDSGTIYSVSKNFFKICQNRLKHIN